MDETHIGYTFWNHPVRNAMPGVQEIQPSAEPALGVALEGSTGSWPVDNARPAVLPALSVFGDRPCYLEVFNRGLGTLAYEIESSAPWLEVDRPSGKVERDQRVWARVDWEAVPRGTESATLTVKGSDGARVRVKVPIFDPESPRPEEIDGFVESDGYVSIEAEHFSQAVAPSGREWKRIPGHGRTLSGMTPFPVDEASTPGGPEAMRLEYRMQLFTTGEVEVEAQLAPTQSFQPGPGRRYAISFDDQPPQVVDVNADRSLQEWERRVANGVAVLSSRHTIASPGPHVLKFWVVDPGVVLQKIVVDAGGLRPSYLGPPESPHPGGPAK